MIFSNPSNSVQSYGQFVLKTATLSFFCLMQQPGFLEQLYINSNEGRDPATIYSQITLDFSSNTERSGQTELLNPNSTTAFRTDGQTGGTIGFTFKNICVRPRSFIIKSGNNEFYNLLSYAIQGREHGSSEWITIDEYRNNNFILKKFTRGENPIFTNHFFQSFRILITGPTYNGGMKFDITNFDVKGVAAAL